MTVDEARALLANADGEVDALDYEAAARVLLDALEVAERHARAAARVVLDATSTLARVRADRDRLVTVREEAEAECVLLRAEVERVAGERDEYKACWHRDLAKGRAVEERLTQERDEACESLRLLRNEALAGFDAGQMRRLREANERTRKAEVDRDRLAAALTCDACSGRGVAESGPCGCRGNGLPGMLLSVREALYDATRDRDRLAAALAEVRDAARACVDAFDDISVPQSECRARNEALRAALAATPADLAAAHDARVRAEALPQRPESPASPQTERGER